MATELKRIDTWRNDRGAYDFVAVLQSDDAPGPLTVKLPPRCLLSYLAFQRHVLERTGCLVNVAWVEGRTSASRDHFWREVVESCLTRHPSPPVLESIN